LGKNFLISPQNLPYCPKIPLILHAQLDQTK
jgi:hypothetical protein